MVLFVYIKNYHILMNYINMKDKNIIIVGKKIIQLASFKQNINP